MISEVKIKNFKSHRNTQIRFSKGLNVIEGSPQSGKTSILRSIVLNATNRPLGAGYLPDFRPKGCTTDILLTLSDGHTVRVEKDINVNRNSGDASISATRFTVDNGEPTSNLSDIAIKTLNMGDINLQKQMAQPFLAVSTGGEVTKYINKVTKLDQSDGWVSEISSLIRKYDETISICDGSIDKTDEKLAEMSDLYSAERILEQALELEFEITERNDCLAKLNKIFLDYDSIVGILSCVDSVHNAIAYFNEAVGIDDVICELVKKRDILVDCKRIQDNLETLGHAKGQMEKAIDDISSIEKSIKFLSDKHQAIGNLVSLNDRVCSLNESFDSLKDKYVGLIKKLGKCPTCFSDIDNDQIKLIKDGITWL